MPAAQAARGGSKKYTKKTVTAGPIKRTTEEAKRIPKYMKNQAKLAKKIAKRDR